MTILLTFDVEDWFQVENFKEYIPYSTWSSRETRVERNTIKLLDLLDDAATPAIPLQATFFILGWVAERFPDLIREIDKRGHEVASHGFNHHLCYNQTPEELKQDLAGSKALLEDIIGREVSGYRAPSFSITDKAIELVREAGYLYDSSYNSYEGHGRYGSLTLPESGRQGTSLCQLSPGFYEIPVSNLKIGNRIIPWGGGGYFRLLPSLLHRAGVKQILKQNDCYVFYMHPWEIDPHQPRVKEAKPFLRFRHYVNLNRTEDKLNKFVNDNVEHLFCSCREFIKKEDI